jgi:hypothetical protein
MDSESPKSLVDPQTFATGEAAGNVPPDDSTDTSEPSTAFASAIAWLQGLASRGITVGIRNGRLHLHPERSYKELTDSELIYLRHHRAEIKACIETAPLTAEPLVSQTTTAEPVIIDRRRVTASGDSTSSSDSPSNPVLPYGSPEREAATAALWRQFGIRPPRY